MATTEPVEMEIRARPDLFMHLDDKAIEAIGGSHMAFDWDDHREGYVVRRGCWYITERGGWNHLQHACLFRTLNQAMLSAWAMVRREAAGR